MVWYDNFEYSAFIVNYIVGISFPTLSTNGNFITFVLKMNLKLTKCFKFHAVFRNEVFQINKKKKLYNSNKIGFKLDHERWSMNKL